MKRTDNYAIQAGIARKRFLTYDQGVLIRKLNLDWDEDYLYLPMLARPYRIRRATGDLEKQVDGVWQDGNSFGEVLTLYDLVCDSSPDRCISGKWKNMASFGLLFHQNLLEDRNDPWAERFQNDPEGFRRVCQALNGKPLPMGDLCYAIELFDGLCIALQLWFGDDEFPPNLRFLWDENALQYIRYETMYYAKGLLMKRLEEEMKKPRC